MGEPLPRVRLAGSDNSRRVQGRLAEEVYGENFDRGGEDARHFARRDGDGSRDSRRLSRGDDLLPDVGGEHKEGAGQAVGERRVGRRIVRAGGRVPRVESASARIRLIRSRAREVLASRKSYFAGGGNKEDDVSSGDKPADQAARKTGAGLLRGCRRVRRREDHRSCDVRKAAPVRDRSRACLREWSAGARERGAHWGKTGARRARPRV